LICRQGPRRNVDAPGASRLGPPGFAAHLRREVIVRPPLPAPRLETLIRHPSVTGRDLSGIYSYRNKVKRQDSRNTRPPRRRWPSRLNLFKLANYVRLEIEVRSVVRRWREHPVLISSSQTKLVRVRR